MNIDTKNIIESIQEKDDISHTVLLLRLYDEYQKVCFNKDENLKEVSLVKINNAFNNIIKKFNSISQEKEDYFENYKVLNSIETQINMLSNYISNFDIHNKIKIHNSIDLITNLECLLKLSITFPQNIENCILNQINNDRFINSEEVKRRLKL